MKWTHDTWRERIEFLLLNTTRIIFGMTGMLFCGHLLFHEAERTAAERNTWLIAGYGAGWLVFAFVVPGAGSWVRQALRDAMKTGSDAKAAYDGKPLAPVTDETPTRPQ